MIVQLIAATQYFLYFHKSQPFPIPITRNLPISKNNWAISKWINSANGVVVKMYGKLPLNIPIDFVLLNIIAQFVNFIAQFGNIDHTFLQ